MDRSLDKASWDAGADYGSAGGTAGREGDVPSGEGSTAPFEVIVDLDRRFLHLVVRGQWDDADFDAYALAYRKAVAELQARGGARFVLTDASDYGVLSPELAERTSALVRSVDHLPAERGAIVTRSVVNQAQSREICSERGTRYFRKVSQALTWLFSDEA